MNCKITIWYWYFKIIIWLYKKNKYTENVYLFFYFIFMNKFLKIVFFFILSITLFLWIIIPSIQIWINIWKEEWIKEKDKLSTELYSLEKKVNELINKEINDKKDIDWLKEYAFTKYETEYNDGDDFSDRELLIDGIKYVENYYKARKDLIDQTGFYDIRDKKDVNKVYLIKEITKTTAEQYICDIRWNQIGNRYFSTPRDRIFNDWIENCVAFENGKLTEKELKDLENKINKIFSKYSLYNFY